MINFEWFDMHFIQKFYFLFPFVRAAAIAVIGFFIVRIACKSVIHVCKDTLSKHVYMLLSNIVFYVGMSIVGVMTLQALGFNLSTLLGAAGVFGVAVGFASQTSMSNIISGIFLLFEQSFSIGDTIQTQGISGVVESIDLFSVKVRTFDNQLIRLPNELLLKQQVTNVTYFDTRRIDVLCEVPTKQDLAQVKKIIEQAVDRMQKVLSTPKSVIIIKEVKQVQYINQQKTVLLIRMWAQKADVFPVKNEFVPVLKELCDTNNINAVISHGN